MVYRMELTYDKILKKLDTKHIAASSTGYTPLPSIHEIN